MKFLLNQIRKEAHNKLMHFDNTVDISELKLLNEDIREARDARVFGYCSLDGDEIIFSLNIVGEVILPCSRTLVDVPYKFEIKTTEIFSTSPYYGEKEEEEEIHFLEGVAVDLYPLILENILLELPYRVVTDDQSILDNALQEGEGWAFSEDSADEEIEETEQKIDPRMKKLKQLLEKKDD